MRISQYMGKNFQNAYCVKTGIFLFEFQSLLCPFLNSTIKTVLNPDFTGLLQKSSWSVDLSNNQDLSREAFTDSTVYGWCGVLCVFIPYPVREGSTLFGDHRGSILSN